MGKATEVYFSSGSADIHLHPLYGILMDVRIAWAPYGAHMNTKHAQKMPFPETIRRFARNRPHAYRIMVAGALDPDWSDRLGGLRIESLPGDLSTPAVTVLEGYMRDQAQLSGVLNTLCDLRLPLLGVELIEADTNHNASGSIQGGETS